MGCGDIGVLELGEWGPEGIRAGRERDMGRIGIGTQGSQTKGAWGHGSQGQEGIRRHGDRET